MIPALIVGERRCIMRRLYTNFWRRLMLGRPLAVELMENGLAIKTPDARRIGHCHFWQIA